MPSTSRNLFTSAVLLFFVLACRVTCESARTEGTESGGLELFKPCQNALSNTEPNGGAGTSTQNIHKFYGHSLVAVNGVMIAIAKASNISRHWEGDADTWSKYVVYGDDKQLAQVTAKDNQWRGPVVVRQGGQERHFTSLYDTKAVAKDNKIFVIVSRNNFGNSTSYSSLSKSDVDPELVVGEVTGSGGEKKVSWQNPQSLKKKFATEMTANSWTKLDGAHSARGVVLGGNTIVFPLVATRGATNEDKICTVIYSEDNGNNWKFPAAATVAEGCQFVILLAWEGKLFMVNLDNFPQRRVYESSDGGKTWAEAAGPLSRLLASSVAIPLIDTTSDLITATIENTSVMLGAWVTRRGEEGAGSAISLWLSDGTRTHDIGPISADATGSDPFTALLYTGGNLFALYPNGAAATDSSLLLLHLAEQLQRIKDVVTTWKAVDGRLSEHCISASGNGVEGRAACVGRMPTVGLIGLLSDKGNATHWDDEYLGVGATVPEAAKKVQNGFELTGRAEAIVWPMRTQGPASNEAQGPYSCDSLTVGATVTINEVPQGVAPLIGVVMTSGKRFVLFYDNQNYWRTNMKGTEHPQKTAWAVGRTYRVVLTVQDGTGSAYVDGRLVGSLEGDSSAVVSEKVFSDHEAEPELPMPRESASKVFFGSYQASQQNGQTRVTVTNAFRYNRLLSNTEVEALEKKEDMTTTVGQPSSKATTPSNGPTRPTHNAPGSTGRTGSSGGLGTEPATSEATQTEAGALEKKEGMTTTTTVGQPSSKATTPSNGPTSPTHNAPGSTGRTGSSGGLGTEPATSEMSDISARERLIGVLLLAVLGPWCLSVFC